MKHDVGNVVAGYCDAAGSLSPALDPATGRCACKVS
jgi:hypothetical protein